MSNNKIYDTAIIGGGLAGLTLSISLAKQGFSVILFEKETYPFHKVCGEYISMESWHFLEHEMGVTLSKMELPILSKLKITAPNGKMLQKKLDLGGFGISRYTLDNCLKNIAEKLGVIIHQQCKVEDVKYYEQAHTITTTKGVFSSKICAGAWGKRSNIDIKWKRNFTKQNNERLNNYVGIKYHVKIDFEDDVIALHNFKNGYCGVSKIENNTFCVCYLTKASNIKNAGGIKQAEATILSENPHLKSMFTKMEILYSEPLAISQISFSKKKIFENNVFMLGDSAGMITPLCGNGMSMAMHAAKILSHHITLYLQNKITYDQLIKQYNDRWVAQFSTRLFIGKLIQSFFGRKFITNQFIAFVQKLPFIATRLIKLSHGKPF